MVGLTLTFLASIPGGPASAHVVVRPNEVLTAGFQTFTIGVPNEKAIPTTNVKLVIPVGVQHVSPTVKPGWHITTEKDGTGEDATVTSVTWDGGSIDAGLRDEFSFSAQVPDKATELQWKAYQTYSDGTVVAWDKDESSHGHDTEGSNSGPFSVTKVVDETEAEASLNITSKAASDAQTAATRAVYIAVVAVVVGFIGIFLATRKK